MQTEELKILLALEPLWTVSINGREFLPLKSADIELRDSAIRFGKYARRITDVEWLRPNIFRIQARPKFRAQPDTFIFYPGDRLPSNADLRRRRRAFQQDVARALSADRQLLHSDKRHGIGGAYPRFLMGSRAAIAVDPEESSTVVNGIMRAAVQWSPIVKKRISVVVPENRRHTIVCRLKGLPNLRTAFEWLQWNGEAAEPLNFDVPEPQTRIQSYYRPNASSEVARLCGLAPDHLQAIPNIAGKAISVRFRGLEIASVTDQETTYPMGVPLENVMSELLEKRRFGSRHPLARAHEERWLESNLMRSIRKTLPWADPDHVYPQVPSFIGEDRNIVDLLTITERGRLVVIEVKVSADPDLPFQAFDYWLAVERHRKAGDFETYGYFKGIKIRSEPALLVVVAPLLAFHRTFDRLTALFPDETELMQIGIHQAWKREIKILRRKGLLG